MPGEAARRANPGFWWVAVLGFAWNVLGGYDFVMTNIRNHVYLGGMPVEAIDYLDELPVWVLGVWAIGVWAGVAGSALMVLRSRFAIPVLVLSLAGFAAVTAHRLATGLPPALMAAPAIALSALVGAAAVLLPVYAWRMRRAGVLR